jgi:tetratricopeptide (TPR) repeat protein
VPEVDKGIQLFEARNYDAANAYYEARLAETPDDAEATYYLGRIALAQQQYDDALGHLKKTVELAPDSASYHFWLAVAYANKVNATQNMMEKGQLAPLMKSTVEKAVELDPDLLDAREFLAQYLFNAPPIVGGDVAKGWGQVEAIKQRDPMRGHLFAARMHSAKKQFDEARAEIEAAVELDPDDPGVHYQLGRLHQDTEDYDDAFAAFERALELEPGHMPSLYQVGRTGAFSGENLDRAVECLKAYMKTAPPPGEPSWAHAQWRLGMVYEKQGHKDLARAAYEKALELDPSVEPAKAALEALDAAE